MKLMAHFSAPLSVHETAKFIRVVSGSVTFN